MVGGIVSRVCFSYCGQVYVGGLLNVNATVTIEMKAVLPCGTVYYPEQGGSNNLTCQNNK